MVYYVLFFEYIPVSPTIIAKAKTFPSAKKLMIEDIKNSIEAGNSENSTKEVMAEIRESLSDFHLGVIFHLSDDDTGYMIIKNEPMGRF